MALTLSTIHAGLAPPAQAQAFCALRDPVAQIYGLFDEANGYRSFVRTIDLGTRKHVFEQLGYPMHRGELGRHTVYVATRDGEPIGLVHVRSERSRWGLVEVAWALDTELRILDFAMQRCRSSRCDELDQAAFRDRIRGKSLDELVGLLSSDGRALVAPELAISDKTKELAAIVVRNASKTIVVTELHWGDVLDDFGTIEPSPAPTSVPASPGHGPP